MAITDINAVFIFRNTFCLVGLPAGTGDIRKRGDTSNNCKKKNNLFHGLGLAVH
jgi:hypothetical protein